MRIALFVSTHGYGHAARSAAVVEALRDHDPSLELEIVTEVPRWFFEYSLRFDFTYTEFRTDVGLAQSNALDEDIDATCRQLSAFWPPNNAVLADFAERLAARSTDLIVADISPLALAIGEASGIPAVLIENFTWDWIYAHQRGETSCLRPFADAYRRLYRDAPTRTIQATPFCVPREGAIEVAPISRRARRPRAETRDRLAIERHRPAVLLTMGGFSWAYDFQDALTARPEIVFVVPGSADSFQVRGNLRLLPHRSSFFHPDLVAATDAIVGKVGYSTLAEAYAARTRFVYVDRPGFPESPVLSSWLAKRLPTLEITRPAFESGAWLGRIDELLATPRPELPTTSGADEAAQAILDLVCLR